MSAQTAGADTLPYMFDRNAETMPRSELNALQLSRLKTTVERAYNKVPHYKKKFDAAGNANAASTSADNSITYDSIPPTVTITGGPANGSLLNVRAGTFTFTVSGAATVACSLDNAAYGACASATTFAFSGLADGSHTFQVRATDPAGNQGFSPLRTWTIDAAGPTITITTPVNGTDSLLRGSNRLGPHRCRRDRERHGASDRAGRHLHAQSDEH